MGSISFKFHLPAEVIDQKRFIGLDKLTADEGPRRLIHSAVWEILHRHFPEAIEFSSSEPPCEKCIVNMEKFRLSLLDDFNSWTACDREWWNKKVKPRSRTDSWLWNRKRCYRICFELKIGRILSRRKTAKFTSSPRKWSTSGDPLSGMCVFISVV